MVKKTYNEEQTISILLFVLNYSLLNTISRQLYYHEISHINLIRLSHY